MTTTREKQTAEPAAERRDSAWRAWRSVGIALLQPILTALILLALWELIIVIFKVPMYIFPSPGEIVDKGIRYAPRIWANYSTTLQSAVLGYLLAVAVSVPGALIIAYSAFAERSFFPGLVLLHMTPKVTLAPSWQTWSFTRPSWA